MIYLSEKHIQRLGIDWHRLIDVIRSAVYGMKEEQYSQPIKPYLRYRNLKNRIIAMPAFIGADFNLAGIKWIASFPDNIHKGLPRAHSVTILNDADTGVPVAIINTANISVIRTASVSGLIMEHFFRVRNISSINVGIIGFGPIGQGHLDMCLSLFGERIQNVFIHDLKPINLDELSISEQDKGKLITVEGWQEAYKEADVFITCTVAAEPYINLPPKKGSLQLNVSLRDYTLDIYKYVKNSIFVDDWDEVCREKTDIEMFALHKGLTQEDTHSLVDLVCDNGMERISQEEAIMCNLMGMASFDIAVASHFIICAKQDDIYTDLSLV
ncbi:2,3-diaminopropionate biosynthesis protein SbnB [Paenibacillus sp. JCM 10914]|uniref:ornithine cyclodeaminase n=1 Tax=Paenibacillus sp. JCM 10914 TaxID=1236974 RepID=UPI0003CC45BA|nr:ornithine cyclodeaminase [Paenibacillus sp. JCM 10914]GAE09531.1 ornithine cyclodeaminase [Paenibacillus sp. JCM 10914]